MPMAVMQVKRNLKNSLLIQMRMSLWQKAMKMTTVMFLNAKKMRTRTRKARNPTLECHAFPSDLNMYCAQTYLNLFVVNGKGNWFERDSFEKRLPFAKF